MVPISPTTARWIQAKEYAFGNGAAMGTDERDLLNSKDAAELLGVEEGRISVMIEEGMITPVDGPDGQQFARAELEATRLMGG